MTWLYENKVVFWDKQVHWITNNITQIIKIHSNYSYENEKFQLLALNLDFEFWNWNFKARHALYNSSKVIPIVNQSFRIDMFPNCLKLHKVIPVYKNGDSADLTNYRPIALESAISKIFVQAVSKRIKCFLNQTVMISYQQ